MPSTTIESVEHWPLQRLIPYARNARTHDDDQVSQIAGSIAEFGFVNPILVGDDNVIIAGHGRLLAALQLGLEQVPLWLDYFSPDNPLYALNNRVAAHAAAASCAGRDAPLRCRRHRNPHNRARRPPVTARRVTPW